MRMTKADYKVPNTNLTLPRGVWVIMPIYSTHRDAEYFPDPESFIPERFTPEAEAQRLPFTYLPFGEGPRVCLGDRFGLQEVRLTLISLLTKFRFKLSPRTEVPIQLMPQVMAVLAPKGGMWIQIEALEEPFVYQSG